MARPVIPYRMPGMNRAFPGQTAESDVSASPTGSPWAEDWFVASPSRQGPTTPHPWANPLPDLRPLLESYRDRIIVAIDWPAIISATEFTRSGRHRDLVELDRRHPVEHGDPGTEASVRVGRRQLARLRACRDLRGVQRYLDAVEEGRAQGWNPIVFGVALAAFNVPHLQGLLHYARTLLRGRARPCKPSDLSETRWAEWMDSLERPLPGAAQALLLPAFPPLREPGQTRS